MDLDWLRSSVHHRPGVQLHGATGAVGDAVAVLDVTGER